MASLDRFNSLMSWENDHCKMVDNSRAVVRVRQDSGGEYHAYEGRDRGVDRICDAKLPKDLEHTWARNIPVYKSTIDFRDCRVKDLRESAVAREYWAD
jgi:hypothetical protein